jgi:hypothetical protein
MTRLGAELMQLLAHPENAKHVSGQRSTDLISLARRELVLGHLADEIIQAGLMAQLEPRLQDILLDGLRDARHSHGHARGEARFVAAALIGLSCPVIILKGSAYVIAGLRAGGGRRAGDLDILIPRSFLGAAEISLQAAGFHMMVKDAYDENYYRVLMHELPPFQHIERKSLIDVHHTILPLTARVQPNAKALIADCVSLGEGLYRLNNADTVLHSAAHWIQDGDLNGGLRNLHDIHRLLTEFSMAERFWQQLAERAALHSLQRSLYYAVQMSHKLFHTAVPEKAWKLLESGKPNPVTASIMEWMIEQRLAGVGLGRQSLACKFASRGLYIRSHWLRMPPMMILTHLARKLWMRASQKG